MTTQLTLTEFMNAEEVKKGIKVMIPEGNLFEVRLIKKGGRFKKTISGYFRSAEDMLNALPKEMDYRGFIAYLVLNEINPECEARINYNCFVETDTTTSDNDITRRNWLYVDIDPQRPADTSSTNEKFIESLELATAIDTYMTNCLNFAPAIRAISGNGAHLQYGIDLPNNKESTDLIKNCLKALDFKFSNDSQKVDTAVHNASRICKLYGTLAQKGNNTEKQPHRMSRIMSAETSFADTAINSRDKLEALAMELPQPDKTTTPTLKNNFKGDSKFDLQAFMNEHGISVHHEKKTDFGTMYVLNECVFDSAHKSPDACIIQFNNGAIGYKCLHNSCQEYKWQNVREMFDSNYRPGEYQQQQRRIEEGYRIHKEATATATQIPATTDQNQDQDQGRGIKKTTAHEFILNMMDGEVEAFQDTTGRKTGFALLDQKQGNLYSGLYVLFAISSLGKTTLAHQIADNMASAGQSVLFFSLEMSTHEMICKSINREIHKESPFSMATALKIRRGLADNEVKEATQRYLNNGAGNLTIIEGDFNYTAQDISNDIRDHIIKTGKRPIVFIDYLQLLKPTPDKRQTTKEVMDTAITELKQVSRKFNITIIAISSVNRANYATEASFESIKESGSIEYTADIVWGLQLKAVHDISEGMKKKEIQAIIKKAKNEHPRKIELVCLKNRYGIASYDIDFLYYSAEDLFKEAVDRPRKQGNFQSVHDLK